MNSTDIERRKAAILRYLGDRLKCDERVPVNPEWNVTHGVFTLVGDVALDDPIEDISEVILATYESGIEDCALTIEENIERDLRWIYFENNQTMLEMLKNKLVLFRRKCQGLPATSH